MWFVNVRIVSLAKNLKKELELQMLSTAPPHGVGWMIEG